MPEGRETARSSATRCSVWYCLREGVATRGGPGWLCRKHADEYDECGWGAAPSSGREATAMPRDVATTLLRALVWCGDQITPEQREQAWAWVEDQRGPVEEMGQ